MALILSGDTGVPASGMPTGSVIQTAQTVKTDTFNTTSASYVDITGLSVTITPTSATSKILIIYDVNASNWTGTTGIRLLRNSTTLYVGDSGASLQASNSAFSYNATVGVFQMPTSGTYLDSPATTSAVTYKIQGVSDGSQVLYINRSYSDTVRTASNITVLEIKQ